MHHEISMTVAGHFTTTDISAPRTGIYAPEKRHYTVCTQYVHLFGALAHLRHNKHEVLLFHVLDYRQELELDFRNRPYLFVDAESGSKLKLHPAELQEKYREAMHRQIQAVKLRCGQMKIDYVEANTNMDFGQILMNFLNKRARML